MGLVTGCCIDAGFDGLAGMGAVVLGWERVAGYIVAGQKIKTWTPISCVLAMQCLAQKDGYPDFLVAACSFFSLTFG